VWERTGRYRGARVRHLSEEEKTTGAPADSWDPPGGDSRKVLWLVLGGPMS
jgi:hypothetical protein